MARIRRKVAEGLVSVLKKTAVVVAAARAVVAAGTSTVVAPRTTPIGPRFERWSASPTHMVVLGEEEVVVLCQPLVCTAGEAGALAARSSAALCVGSKSGCAVERCARLYDFTFCLCSVSTSTFSLPPPASSPDRRAHV